MERRTALLASFVPRLLQERFARSPAPLNAPEAEDLMGAALFADISGFSTAAESLAALGPRGVEELSVRLNRRLDGMIDAIHRYGGDVIKLAGDAVVGFWTNDHSMGDAVVAAVACGLAMQDEIREEARHEPIHFPISVGIGAGSARMLLLGGLHRRWETLFAGAALIQMGPARDLARPGEVVLSPEARAFVGSDCELFDVEHGSARVVTLHNPVVPAPYDPPTVERAAEDALLTHVPAAIRARLAQGQSDWLSELRRVSVIFVNLPDWRDVSLQSLKHAQSVMLALQGAVYRYEGSLNKLSVDDKGVTLVAVLGLPPLAHEDDPERAVAAGLMLQSTLRSLRVRSAIGISTGLAFCGTVGNRHRQEYTVLGTAVNLAARLMQQAPGDVLCDLPTRDAAAGRFRFEALRPLAVKGATVPVPTFRPFSEAPRRPKLSRPLIGRISERQRLTTKLDDLRSGTGGAITVEGEAGIGKSMLVADLQRGRHLDGLHLLVPESDAVEHSTPYHAWRSILGHVLEVDGLVDAATRRDVVLATVAADEHAAKLAPLLNSILSLDLPDTPLTAEMTGQLRADNLVDLCTHLLRRGREHLPLVVVLEDAHWFDSASWAVAMALARAPHPTLLIATLRPTEMPAEYNKALDALLVQRLVLQPMPAVDAMQLVAARLAEGHVSEDLLTALTDRAEGNPFFLDELIQAVVESGAVVLSDGSWSVAKDGPPDLASLPNSLQSVIMRRIDRLSSSTQLTVKVASVIGRAFSVRLLSDVHPIPEARSELPIHLGDLERNDLASVDSDQPQPSYVFKHVLTRDVAYELLLFSQRQHLHRSVATWYEQRQTDEAGAAWPLMAHHWSKGGDHRKAIDYLERAGTQALRAGAYAEALTFMLRARDLRQSHGVPNAAGPAGLVVAVRLEREMAEAYYGLGRLTETTLQCEKVVALLGLSSGKFTAARLGLALMEIAKQAYFRLATQPETAVNGFDGEKALEASRTFEILAMLRYFSNDQIGTAQATVAALNHAERAGASVQLARSFANAGLAASLGSLHSLAFFYFRKAAATARQVGHTSAIAWVHLAQAMFEISIARWEDGIANLNQALTIHEDLGDRRRWIETMCLLSTAEHFRGRFVERLDLAGQVSVVANQTGDIQARGWGLLDQIESLLPIARFDEAEQLLRLLVPMLESNVGRADAIWAAGLRARYLMDTGDAERAVKSATHALSLMNLGSPMAVYTMEGYAGTAEALLGAYEAGSTESPTAVNQAVRHLVRFSKRFPVARPRALRLSGSLEWLRGGHTRARRIWQRAGLLADQLNMPYERAVVDFETARHLPVGPARERATGDAQLQLERLGARRELLRIGVASASHVTTTPA